MKREDEPNKPAEEEKKDNEEEQVDSCDFRLQRHKPNAAKHEDLKPVEVQQLCPGLSPLLAAGPGRLIEARCEGKMRAV